MSRTSLQYRRAFLQKLSATLAAGSSMALFPQLSLLPSALAAPRGGVGYKALVCIYLNGANDSFNWLMPRDSENAGSHYDRYRVARGGVYSPTNTIGLAHAYADLLPISPSNVAAGFGLHPGCTDFSVGSQNHSGLQSLFNSGKAAFVCNAGPLITPISKTQYNAGAARPAQLFSHNDQALQWQIGMSANSPLSRYGWGGRVAHALGQNALSNGLSPAISVAGSTRFLLGDAVTPYQIATNGVNLIDNYSATAGSNYQAARRAVLNDLLDDAYAQPFSKEYAAIMRRSLSVGEDLSVRLASAAGSINTVFPAGNTLAAQLQMVARLIKISKNDLAAERQVYFVNFGSFDLHDGMFVAGQPVASSGHGALISALNQALGAFWSALVEVGAENDVTSFTMSDFGRTLTGNGNGSDHAWGGNLLVLGGAVQGNKLYGRYPQMIINNNDDANQDWSFTRGQYIPTTAVDQVGATLAKWMGVSDNAALDAVFPNLSAFSARDLGFMAP